MFEKLIQIADQKLSIINLTEPLREDVSVFPGDPTPKKNVIASIDKDFCQYHSYTLGDHHFHPHGDAPNHHNPEYKDRGFEYWNLDYAFNQAILIDLSKSPEACSSSEISFLTHITREHLAPFTQNLKQCGAIVIRTGYDRWVESNFPHHVEKIPYLNPDAANFLADFPNLKVIGIDSLTIDKPGENYSHRKLRDKFIVECLVHLYCIPDHSRNSFLLQTSPIAIVGATGGPVAAFAYIAR